LILGLGFGLFQFLGYKGLVDKGVMFNTWIIVNDGRYGDYFEIKKDGHYLSVDNNQYTYQGEVIKGADSEALKAFARQFITHDRKDLSRIDYGTYSLYYKGEPLALIDGTLVRPSGEKISLLDYERLQFLAQNIMDERADFFAKGEMGKDFKLLYKGKELDYKDRKLFYDGQELSTSLNNKLLRGNKDTASAYFYLITVLHLLHVVAGIIMLFIYVKRSFAGDIIKDNGLAVKAGSIFWHFLGVLWLYLLLFLIFIH
jgi:cytochrome c oxidase subunit III